MYGPGPTLPKTGFFLFLGMSTFFSKLFILWFIIFVIFLLYNFTRLYWGEKKMKKKKIL